MHAGQEVHRWRCALARSRRRIASCSQQPTTALRPPPPAPPPTLIATGTIPSVANDLASNSAHHSLDVPGEQFALTVDYWTDYDAAAWQTLQPKKINLSVASRATANRHRRSHRRSSSDPSAASPPCWRRCRASTGLPIAATDQDPSAIAGYLINCELPVRQRADHRGIQRRTGRSLAGRRRRPAA